MIPVSISEDAMEFIKEKIKKANADSLVYTSKDLDEADLNLE